MSVLESQLRGFGHALGGEESAEQKSEERMETQRTNGKKRKRQEFEAALEQQHRDVEKHGSEEGRDAEANQEKQEEEEKQDEDEEQVEQEEKQDGLGMPLATGQGENTSPMSPLSVAEEGARAKVNREECMQCLPIGSEAAGVINASPGDHYAKFLCFLHGDKTEDDLFLGLHPIYNMANSNVISHHEMLLRGVGASTHSAPYGVFRKWTPAQEREFIRMEIKVAREAGKVTGTKISMNCSLAALSPEFAMELDSELGDIILEITSWDKTLQEKLAMMPNVSIWLDDLPVEAWSQVPVILEECKNVSGIKIGYKDSCVVMRILTPWKTDGVPNDGMAQTLKNISSEDTDSAAVEFGNLVSFLADLSSVNLVMEISCTLADLVDLGYLEPECPKDFMLCQGMKHHAMVRKIVCDYSRYKA